MLRNQRGFTFIEMIAASLVVAIGIVAIYETFIVANNLNRQSTLYLTATKFAQQELDYYRTQLFTTDFTATTESDSSSLLTNSTDVSSSMPALLPGSTLTCTQAQSGTNGKYACVTIAAIETGRYHVTVFVGYRDGTKAQKSVQLTTFVAQNGIGTNPTVWTYYFNATDDSGGGPTNVGSFWTNPLNGFDGSLTTSATAPASSPSTNGLIADGTNAPPQGPTNPTTVEARVYGTGGNSGGIGDNMTDGDIYASSNTSTSLGTTHPPVGSTGWGSWLTLTAPGGGWTWPIIHHLRLNYQNHSSAAASISEVQIRVIQ